MNINKLKLNTDQRPFSMTYHDSIDSDILENIYQFSLFIVLKRFSDENNKCFPSLKKLAKVSRMSQRKVQETLKELEEKNIISIENRARKDGGKSSNLYTIHDYKELWKNKNIEQIKETVDIEELQLFELAKKKGYILIKEREPETLQTDQSNNDSSTQNYNLSKNNNSTNTKKNQGEIEETYTLVHLKERLCYDDMLRQNPCDADMIDTFFHYLHEAMNTTKQTIRVNGEDKPREVVISVLSKLEYFDFLYAVEKYKKNTSKVNNQRAYITTLLYNAKSQSNADITNQVQHDMYGQD